VRVLADNAFLQASTRKSFFESLCRAAQNSISCLGAFRMDSLDRRTFLAGVCAFAATPAFSSSAIAPLISEEEVARIDRERILRAADRYLTEQPITITAASSPRSHGGLHDYFSEGDYWWPDPKNLAGPYIRRDGYSNPANFNAHREALIRLSVHVPALTSAWLVTHDARYAPDAAWHLRAW
jgi:hypothetical protein